VRLARKEEDVKSRIPEDNQNQVMPFYQNGQRKDEQHRADHHQAHHVGRRQEQADYQRQWDSDGVND
jgi:hypothetical protein